MAISLIDLNYDSNQNPVGVDKSFTVTLSLLVATDDDSPTGTVRFWSPAAYAITPASVDVSIPAGQTSADRNVLIQLRGTAQPQQVRIYAECDERHSVFVQVG